MNKIFAGFALCLATAALQAQVIEADEWEFTGRPEHYDAPLDSTGRLGMRKVGTLADATLKSFGTQRVPVVLVAFADKAFSVADGTPEGVNAYYQKYCNGTLDGKLYRGHGSYGSIRDYFVQQSDSAFLPEFDVIGPVTLPGGYAQYGKNSGTTKDVGYNSFTREAISLAVSQYGDWYRFDNNGNGTIDMVFFIFAGLGENAGGDADCIWPKESTRRTTIGDYQFDCSGCTAELRPMTVNGVRQNVADGVGVFIHELSHALGLPDFYDTKYQAFGMDLWSVMDYGEYANNGYTPGNYNAYERDFMGWKPLLTLDKPCIVSLKCFADGGGEGYKIVNEANPNEYYIIENRQAKGWDTSVGGVGHGLQVTHVDYVKSLWTSNKVNTDCPTHQHMTIVPANNDLRIQSELTGASWRQMLGGQLFPGNTYNYNLTDDTTPAAEVYAGGLLHRPLRNIEERDGIITLCYCTNGQLGTPVAEEAEDVAMDGFSLAWESVEHATQYVCHLYRDGLLVQADTVADTRIQYARLAPGTSFSVRLLAKADMPEDYLDSEWSEEVYVETLADYISSVPESEKMVYVYSMGGLCVARCHADEVKRLLLQRGVYVLRYANGACRKVLLN